MASNGRLIPPPHLRRPLPGHDPLHPPDQFALGIRPAPPREVMEQKLSAQQLEMQRLASENQRLAASHGNLRHELVAAQHELQMLHAHVQAIRAEREQRMKGLSDKTAKIETELKAAEPIKKDLHKARTEAEKLVTDRQELMSKVHQLNQEIHKAHIEAQQLPDLMSELEGLRQEQQRCRISYDYEKKLFSDHLESLQVMEKNYMTMAREVGKLHSQLADIAGGHYPGTSGNNENEASGRTGGQNMYGDSHALHQGQGYLTASAAAANSGADAVAASAANAAAASGITKSVGTQYGSGAVKPGYEVPRVPGYDPSKGAGEDAQRMMYGYDAQRGRGYDMQRAPGYDPETVAAYEAQRLHGYNDMQWGANYDAARNAVYDALSRGLIAAQQGQMAPPVSSATPNNMAYGSATPPTLGGSGYNAAASAGRAGNPVKR